MPADTTLVPIMPGQVNGVVDPALFERIAKPGTDDDVRWDQYTWLHWWAWNRDALLQNVRRRAIEVRPTSVQIKQAADAILLAARNGHPAVRIEAAIALGRTHDAAALTVLKQISTDPIAEVRYAAMLGIGLLHAPDSERTLAAALTDSDAPTVLGAVAGIGMLDHLSDGTTAALVKAYKSNAAQAEVRRMIFWCLRVQHSAAGGPLARTVIKQEPDSLVVSEAILTLAPFLTADDAKVLSDIAAYCLFFVNKPGAFPGESLPGGVGPSVDVYNSFHRDWYQEGVLLAIKHHVLDNIVVLPLKVPCLQAVTPAPSMRNPRNTYIGWRRTTPTPLSIWQCQTLYTATLMALGQAPHDVIDAANLATLNLYNRVVWHPQMQVANPRGMAGGGFPVAVNSGGLLTGTLLNDAFISVPTGRTIYQGPAMLAFARVNATINPESQAFPELLDVLQTGPREQQLNVDAPNAWIRRGFAAVAIATQDAQRPNQGAVDPRTVSAWDPFYRDLIAAAARPDAPDVRAAYAMAPAIARRAAVLNALMAAPGPKGEHGGLAKGSPFVYAHVLLARAMLGDSTAATEAAKLLGPGQPHLDLTALPDATQPTSAPATRPTNAQLNDYWRRSILLTVLALSGDKRNIPAINGQWGHDEWATYEAARAMGWCRAFENISPCAALVTHHADSPYAAVAVRTLGELLDTEHTARLSRLLIGDCYVQLAAPDSEHFTWTPDHIQPMSHLLADPPLYRFLTAGFDPTVN